MIKRSKGGAKSKKGTPNSPRRTRRRVASDKPEESYARLWLLRGLLKTGGWRRFLADLVSETEDEEEAFELASDDYVASFLRLDLSTLYHGPASRFPGLLRRAQAELAAKKQVLPANLAGLAHELGLSELECRLLLFAALAKTRGPFRKGLAYLGSMSGRDATVAAIAGCLGEDPPTVERALSAKAPLALTGLVALDPDGFASDVDDWITVLPGLGARLFDPDLSARSLLSAYLKPPGTAPRPLTEFAHLAGPLEVLGPLLAGALRQRHAGVNVLLYGPPGTGKTELARALAPNLDAHLLEVSATDEEGAALDRAGRIKALRLVGRLGTQRRPALILFDEVEDYFGQERARHRHWRAGPGKGFSVELLEGAPAPTVWITNSLEDIDAALLRRFSYLLEVPPPPPAVRDRMAVQYLDRIGLGTHPLRRRLAAQEQLAPGLIARAL